MATVAISLAAGFAAQTVASWLQPTKVIDNGGLSDLSIPKSNYGVVMPQAWGTVAMSGNLIWATHKEEQIKKKKRGKGGGGTVERERSYYGNCAWLFAYTPNSPAQYFKRVWFNNRVAYSTVGDAETIDNGNAFASQYLRFYLGTSTQNPDPLLESLKPSSSYDYGLPHDPIEREAALIELGLDPNTIYTPGYRYRSYLVAERLPLNDFGNNLPTVKAEIVFSETCYLADIIDDICLQAGLNSNQIELGSLSNIEVTGFYLDNVTKASEALQLLQQCYFFDIVQSDGKLIFLPQGQTRPVINLDNLAAHIYGQARPQTYSEEFPDLEALPSEVDVNFIDPDLDYDENTAKARSQVANSQEKKVYNLPIVLTADYAIALAEKMLHQHYLTSKKYSFTLPPAWAFLEVGDRVAINRSDLGEVSSPKARASREILQITNINLGANLLIKVDAKLFDSASINTVNVIRSVNTGNYNQPLDNNTILSQGDTNLLVLDIPLISDRDPEYGVYIAGGGGSNWRGADIYVSINSSSYELVAGLDTYGIYGTATTVIGSDVEVVLENGALVSATTADLDIGYNKALVGDEIIQFETATLTATNTYVLSGLRRGLRGTEWVNNHAAGERFVLLTGDNAYLERIVNNAIAPGQTLNFKALTDGQSLDSVSPVVLTYQGNDLKPYAPVNLYAVKDETNNITIDWDRRDRKAGEATDLTKIPLSETREEYRLQIKESGNAIRTVTIYKNNYNYLSQEQVSDFGSTQTSITVDLYQVSSVVGNGFLAPATLTPDFLAATPIINGFTPVQGNESDTVTVTGSGLAGITEININGLAQDNLAVASDSEASFVVAAGTNSGLITAVALGGTGTSAIAFIVGGTDGNGHVIQDDNNSYAARANLKFIGNVTVTDDDANDATIVDISSSSASSGTFAEVTTSTASLNQGEAENIDLNMAAISLIREITVSHAARLRLFGMDSDRLADDADSTTQLNIDEAIDLEFSSNLTRRFAMGIMINNLDSLTENIIYGKLFNNSGAANNLNLTIKYYAIKTESDNNIYQIEITINSAVINSPLIDFPIYVNLSDLPNGFWLHITNSEEIRVKNSLNNNLAREIFNFNSLDQSGELWFLADMVSDNQDTTFKIEYGNTELIEPDPNSNIGKYSVWTNYSFISHDGGRTNSVNDDYQISNNSVTETNGKLDKGSNFDGNSYIGIDNHQNLNFGLGDFTIQAWINTSGSTERQGIIAKRNGSGSQFIWWINTNNTLQVVTVDSANTNIQFVSNYALTNQNYNLCHLVFDRSNNSKLYVNGSLIETFIPISPDSLNNTNILELGSGNATITGSGVKKIIGTLDEIRISKTIIADDIIAAEYLNQNNPNSFYTISAEIAI